MNKGVLKQMQYEFTALVGAVTEIKHKQSSKFYLVWKIVHQNEGIQIASPQYLQPDKNGVIAFSSELKTNVRVIFNKDTNTFLKKKVTDVDMQSMLCLNYIDEEGQEQPKLAGLVTMDLGGLAGKASLGGFLEYTLERSPFKNSTITIKVMAKKLKEETMSSFNWESKQLSIEGLFDKTKDAGSKNGSEKKSGNNRKNLNKLIKDQFNENKRTVTQVSEQPLKQILQRQRIENLLTQLKKQNQNLLNKVQTLEIQNQKLKDISLPQPSPHPIRTLEQQLSEIQQPTTTQNDYFSLMDQNKHIMHELEKVTLQLAKKDQQYTLMKCEYDRLKKREKKPEKVEQNIKLEQQVYFLSQQIMRLHEELAQHRETQIENNELKRQKQFLETKLNEFQTRQIEKDQTIEKLKHEISNIAESSKIQESIFQDSFLKLSCTSKLNNRSLSTSVQSLRHSLKQGLVDITSKHTQNSNSKIQDVSNELLKLKNISLNGMTMQSKKSFLGVVKRLEAKIGQISTL